MTKQTKFISSPLGMTLEKQTKVIKDQEEQQLKALEKRGKQLIMSNG